MFASGTKGGGGGLTLADLDWQNSVLEIADNTTSPPTEVSGDRYLLDVTGGGVHADWDGAAVNDIVEFNGAIWEVTYVASGDEGGACWVEDLDTNYIWDGSTWAAFGSTISHNNTLGLQGGTTDEYYHLTAGQRNEATRDATNVLNGLMPSGKLTAWDAAVTHITSDGSDHSKVGANETAIGLNTTHRTSDGSDHSKVGANETAIGLNTTHRTGSGSGHSDVALNTTHRSSDGSGHSDVALNTTHRNLSNNPHTVTAAQVGLGSVSNVETSDVAYNATSWDANVDAATKNAIRDKIVTMDAAAGLNTTHRTSDGTDHGYINQDVTTTGNPMFGQIGVNMTASVEKFSLDGIIAIKERSGPDAGTVTFGKIWVLNSAPNTLWFKDDESNDFQLGLQPNDTAYDDASWNENTDSATKNAIRDKINVMDITAGLNTTHRSSDGSNHSKVGANETAIGLNTTHRGVTSGNPHNVLASEIVMARIAGSTFSSVQHMQDTLHSAGWLSGGGITDDADGTITVAAGTGLIRATDSALAQIIFMDWAQELGALVDLANNDINWIYAEYNGGSPQVIATTTERTDYRTNILLAKISRDGTSLHINEAEKHSVGDHANSMILRLQTSSPYGHVSGGILSEKGTIKIGVTAGSWWRGLTPFTTAAFDSNAADRFSYWYRQVSDSGWVEVTTQDTIDNARYDDNSGSLASLSNNKYGVHWVYLEVDDHVDIVYGRGNYTLSEAEDAQPSASVPNSVVVHGFLVGKIIIKEGTTVFTQIESVNGSTFQGALATDHNSLISLQGGSADEYYHMTSAEHTAATRDATNGLNGLMPTGKLVGWDGAATHVTSDGSNHSKVTANETAIGLNTTHRGVSSGNPHSVIPANLSLVIGTNTQAYGAVLDDFNTLGQVASDGQMLVGTAAGVFAYESGATLRTSIGVGTGDTLTIQELIVNTVGGGAAITALSGAADEWSAYTMGRTAIEMYLAVSDSPHLFFQETAAGDILWRLEDDTKKIHIGMGDGTAIAQLVLSNTAATFTGDIIIADGKTIGQAAGPLLTFDDAGDILAISGCEVTSTGNITAKNAVIFSKAIAAADQATISIIAGGNNNTISRLKMGDLVDDDIGMIAYQHGSQANDNQMEFTTSGIVQVIIASDGGIHLANLKSGTDQSDAGAVAGELYSDSNDDNTVKIGV